MELRWIWSAVLVLAIGSAIPARAASINGCIDSCFGAYSGPNQEELRQNCVNNCPNRVNYGAIAYAPANGAYGYSYHYHSADDANQHALANCSEQDKGCEVVLTFSETCAALAAGDNNRFAATIGDGAGDATGNALSECRRKRGKHCEIKAWACARD